MASEVEFLDKDLSAYIVDNSTSPDDVQNELIAVTSALGEGIADMRVGTAQGTFMSLLTTVLQPRFAVEIGTFTGYSALAVAKALPLDGQLLCCDFSEEWTAIAREYWKRAGVDDRIDLRIGPALDTLGSLPSHPRIDLAFIDADKESYIPYYEELLSRLSERGVILVDNTLWGGFVVDPECTEAEAEAIRAFNAHVITDPRVMVAMLPIGDGLSMITHASK